MAYCTVLQLIIVKKGLEARFEFQKSRYFCFGRKPRTSLS